MANAYWKEIRTWLTRTCLLQLYFGHLTGHGRPNPCSPCLHRVYSRVQCGDRGKDEGSFSVIAGFEGAVAVNWRWQLSKSPMFSAWFAAAACAHLPVCGGGICPNTHTHVYKLKNTHKIGRGGLKHINMNIQTQQHICKLSKAFLGTCRGVKIGR